MNPTDQFRKEARKRELKKNKKQRIMVRTAVLKGKDPMKLLEEMEVIDRMEYNPMQPPSLNEKVLREKRKKLRETYDRVFKLYEKERPEYAVELRKANAEYEKTRIQLQLHFDQVRNAERVQLDQIPLPDAPVDPAVPGAIPLPTEMPMHMLPGVPLPIGHPLMQPHSILKKTSAYGPQRIGPQIPAQFIRNKRRKPPGPPPGPPPALSDSDEDVARAGVEEDLDGQDPMDVDMRERPEHMATDIPRHYQDSSGRSRRIRFADDDYDDRSHDSDREERLQRRRERRERKNRRREQERERSSGKKKVSALQAMMLKMAGQEVPDEEDEEERRPSSSSSSSSSSSEDEDDRRRDRLMNKREEDRRIYSKDREIARRREEISQLDDRPPGLEDPADRLTEEEAAALAAARLIEEAEAEAETRHLETGEGDDATDTTAPRLNPPGPPPGLPQNVAGLTGLPPGPPPGAPPMFMRPPPLRGAPIRLMPPGPPPGRPQGMPPGPPPGLPPSLRAPGLRIPAPVGIPPPRMIRLPGGPSNILPPGIPPPLQAQAAGGSSNILSAPPSIMRPRGEGAGLVGGSAGQSRVTIQAKPQIKSKMGDVTRFMPTALKVKREHRDQKGRLRVLGKEEEPKMIGAQVLPQPAPAAQTRTKDDAYDQFMKEMEGLI